VVKANSKEPNPVNTPAINEAIQTYHAATTPDAVNKAVTESESRGIPQSAEDVMWKAKMTLLEAVEKEMPGSGAERPT
jgi:hypothetical protein